MAGQVKLVPQGYHSITPYLFVRGAVDAIDFYKGVFQAEEVTRRMDPKTPSKVIHSELRVGDAQFMLSDEYPEEGMRAPKEDQTAPFGILIYVKDVDATIARAINAGAKLTRPTEEQFWGDRLGCISDPWGHNWFVATHIEDLSPEEMARRRPAAA